MKYRESRRLLQARAALLAERLKLLREALGKTSDHDRPIAEVAIEALAEELQRLGRELRSADHVIF